MTENFDVPALRERYMLHCRRYYRRNRGDLSGEVANISASLDLWLAYSQGKLPNHRFQVKAWQDQLITEGLSRGYINQCLDRLRRWVDWGVDHGLMPEAMQSELRRCRRLKQGCGAKERNVPTPPSLDTIRAAVQELERLPRDIMRLYLCTGARPSEFLELTNAEVYRCDDAGPRIVPIQHKGARRKDPRSIPLNAEAVSIIDDHWRHLLPDDPLFPSTARNAQPGDHYTLSGLNSALKRACKRAGVPPFTAREVRRRVARHVRRHKGLDAAQALLGHKHSSTTEIYAPLDPGEAECLPIAREATEVL